MIHLSPETVALAERLAAARGISVEEAVKLALEESAHGAGFAVSRAKQRDLSPAAIAARKMQLQAFARMVSEMPVLDPRSPREIMDDLNAL